jgi:hypothetical protein
MRFVTAARAAALEVSRCLLTPHGRSWGEPSKAAVIREFFDSDASVGERWLHLQCRCKFENPPEDTAKEPQWLLARLYARVLKLLRSPQIGGLGKLVPRGFSSARTRWLEVPSSQFRCPGSRDRAARSGRNLRISGRRCRFAPLGDAAQAGCGVHCGQSLRRRIAISLKPD